MNFAASDDAALPSGNAMAADGVCPRAGADALQFQEPGHTTTNLKFPWLAKLYSPSHQELAIRRRTLLAVRARHDRRNGAVSLARSILSPTTTRTHTTHAPVVQRCHPRNPPMHPRRRRHDPSTSASPAIVNAAAGRRLRFHQSRHAGQAHRPRLATKALRPSRPPPPLQSRPNPRVRHPSRRSRCHAPPMLLSHHRRTAPASVTPFANVNATPTRVLPPTPLGNAPDRAAATPSATPSASASKQIHLPSPYKAPRLAQAGASESFATAYPTQETRQKYASPSKPLLSATGNGAATMSHKRSWQSPLSVDPCQQEASSDSCTQLRAIHLDVRCLRCISRHVACLLEPSPFVERIRNHHGASALHPPGHRKSHKHRFRHHRHQYTQARQPALSSAGRRPAQPRPRRPGHTAARLGRATSISPCSTSPSSSTSSNSSKRQLHGLDRRAHRLVGALPPGTHLPQPHPHPDRPPQGAPAHRVVQAHLHLRPQPQGRLLSPQLGHIHLIRCSFHLRANTCAAAAFRHFHPQPQSPNPRPPCRPLPRRSPATTSVAARSASTTAQFPARPPPKDAAQNAFPHQPHQLDQRHGPPNSPSQHAGPNGAPLPPALSGASASALRHWRLCPRQSTSAIHRTAILASGSAPQHRWRRPHAVPTLPLAAAIAAHFGGSLPGSAAAPTHATPSPTPASTPARRIGASESRGAIARTQTTSNDRNPPVTTPSPTPAPGKDISDKIAAILGSSSSAHTTMLGPQGLPLAPAAAAPASASTSAALRSATLPPCCRASQARTRNRIYPPVPTMRSRQAACQQPKVKAAHSPVSCSSSKRQRSGSRHKQVRRRQLRRPHHRRLALPLPSAIRSPSSQAPAPTQSLRPPYPAGTATSLSPGMASHRDASWSPEPEPVIVQGPLGTSTLPSYEDMIVRRSAHHGRSTAAHHCSTGCRSPIRSHKSSVHRHIRRCKRHSSVAGCSRPEACIASIHRGRVPANPESRRAGPRSAETTPWSRRASTAKCWPSAHSRTVRPIAMSATLACDRPAKARVRGRVRMDKPGAAPLANPASSIFQNGSAASIILEYQKRTAKKLDADSVKQLYQLIRSGPSDGPAEEMLAYLLTQTGYHDAAATATAAAAAHATPSAGRQGTHVATAADDERADDDAAAGKHAQRPELSHQSCARQFAARPAEQQRRSCSGRTRRQHARDGRVRYASRSATARDCAYALGSDVSLVAASIRAVKLGWHCATAGLGLGGIPDACGCAAADRKCAEHCEQAGRCRRGRCASVCRDGGSSGSERGGRRRRGARVGGGHRPGRVRGCHPCAHVGVWRCGRGRLGESDNEADERAIAAAEAEPDSLPEAGVEGHADEADGSGRRKRGGPRGPAEEEEEEEDEEGDAEEMDLSAVLQQLTASLQAHQESEAEAQGDDVGQGQDEGSAAAAGAESDAGAGDLPDRSTQPEAMEVDRDSASAREQVDEDGAPDGAQGCSRCGRGASRGRQLGRSRRGVVASAVGALVASLAANAGNADDDDEEDEDEEELDEQGTIGGARLSDDLARRECIGPISGRRHDEWPGPASPRLLVLYTDLLGSERVARRNWKNVAFAGIDHRGPCGWSAARGGFQAHGCPRENGRRAERLTENFMVCRDANEERKGSTGFG
ncbi:hypothetical protein L1887_50144 [Cichorium endivia]|nr:hypothetical protein L1887_50144 [Cichorium endivia]